LRRPRTRLGWRWFDFRCGLESHFPLCCVLRFTFHPHKRLGPLQGLQRGVCGTGDNQWVPCLVFHKDKYGRGR